MLGKTLPKRKESGKRVPPNYGEVGIFCMVLKEKKQKQQNRSTSLNPERQRNCKGHQFPHILGNSLSLREQKGGTGGQASGHKTLCSHWPCWGVTLLGVGGGGTQRLTSVISSCDHPRDHKEHISKQVQKTISYLNRGVLVGEVLISHKV